MKTPVSGLAPALESQRSAVIRYRRPVPIDWWLHNRRYLLYMARDFSPIPLSIWLVWFVVEINRLKAGAGGYHPNLGPGFVAFSIVCFLFALLHSITFLNLSGVILQIRLGSRTVAPAAVRAANFALWLVVSVVVGGALVYLARLG